MKDKNSPNKALLSRITHFQLIWGLGWDGLSADLGRAHAHADILLPIPLSLY